MADFQIGFAFAKNIVHPAGFGYDLRPNTPLSGICLHSTQGQPNSRFENECIYLRDSPNVSAHYVIGRAGEIQRILDPGIYRAWHAGVSSWQGVPNCNDYMCGIELVHAGTDPYPDVQLDAARWLCLELLHNYPTIELENIVAHRWIALPPGRKTDPTGWSDADLRAWIDELGADDGLGEGPDPLTEPPDRPFAGLPTLSPIMFELVLLRKHSPVLDERPALEYYLALMKAGVDPATWLAFFQHESELGTNSGPCPPRKNSGCVRTLEDAALGQGTSEGFAVYPSWLNSVIDWAKRMTGPKYRHADGSQMWVREALQRYAPASDGNTPEKYADDVLWQIAQWEMQSKWGG